VYDYWMSSTAMSDASTAIFSGIPNEVTSSRTSAVTVEVKKTLTLNHLARTGLVWPLWPTAIRRWKRSRIMSTVCRCHP